jgi:hypothetical protein
MTRGIDEGRFYDFNCNKAERTRCRDSVALIAASLTMLTELAGVSGVSFKANAGESAVTARLTVVRASALGDAAQKNKLAL